MLMRSFVVSLLFVSPLAAQTGAAPAPAATPAATGAAGAAQPAFGGANANDTVIKALENQKWHEEMGDISEVREIRYTSVPPHYAPNPTAPGAKNPLIVHAMVFIPKNIDRTKRQPFLVFAHQGARSDFGRDYEYPEVRELLLQGYSIIAPDYRGSTGYGAGFSNLTDYGGAEVEDVFRARQWMLDNYDFLDEKRIGIIGWSHGGFITLMNTLLHPGAYAAAYAGVPDTDLILRLGYHNSAYQGIFSAPADVGKTVQQDIQEYRKRSPINYADKLETPLLIHGNTNDEDVNVIEQREFIDALKAAGKHFEYKIYENAPGGHEFGRLDTKFARETRHDIYVFLAKYLYPEWPEKETGNTTTSRK
jgi:dipeptidyl aminopeptidase/acylaminoacyl peptidase